MHFTHSRIIPMSRAALWDFLMDVPRVSRCVPGVQEVAALEGDAYGGLLRIKVGPIVLNLRGKIQIENQDENEGRATMRAEADDRRLGGSVKATMVLSLNAHSSAETEFCVDTDLTIMGKIGEFGQPVIRKKADAMMEEFAQNVALQMAGDGNQTD